MISSSSYLKIEGTIILVLPSLSHYSNYACELFAFRAQAITCELLAIHFTRLVKISVVLFTLYIFITRLSHMLYFIRWSVECNILLKV